MKPALYLVAPVEILPMPIDREKFIEETKKAVDEAIKQIWINMLIDNPIPQTRGTDADA